MLNHLQVLVDYRCCYVVQGGCVEVAGSSSVDVPARQPPGGLPQVVLVYLSSSLIVSCLLGFWP